MMKMTIQYLNLSTIHHENASSPMDPRKGNGLKIHSSVFNHLSLNARRKRRQVVWGCLSYSRPTRNIVGE